jgi:hypothetical protein
MNEMTIAQAKFTLKQAGYFVDNLWHIQDVYNVAEGNIQKDQAMQVLSIALTNDATNEQIWYSIKVGVDIVTEKIK